MGFDTSKQMVCTNHASSNWPLGVSPSHSNGPTQTEEKGPGWELNQLQI